MATITGKRFQITDGASTPTNLFPYTVSEAVYGLSNTISNAISTALSALSLSTYAGTSAIGSSTQPVYYNGSALVAANLSTTYAPYNANGYLPLSAGASYPLTGSLFIQSGNDAKIILDNTDADTNYQGISFRKNGTEYGRLGIFSVGSTNLQWIAGGVFNTIIHSGNYSSYALPLTGGTMSGDISLGTNAVVFGSSPSSSWENPRNSGLRILNALGTAVTGAPRTYVVGLSVSGYYGFQLASYGGDIDAFYIRSTGDGSTAHDWRTIWHSGNSNKSDVAWAASRLNVGYQPGQITANRAEISCISNTDVPADIWLGANSGAYWSINCQDSSSSYDLSIYNANLGHLFRITGGSGNVGIGTTSPSQKLHVAGNILATGAITAGSASDARLKTNIQSLSAEAAKRIVMALNPVTFTWNEKATELYDQYKGDDLGMIAQEVEPYLPQAVGTIFEKYKRLDYTKVISPLVKVAQDHESRIRQLEAENRELRKRLNMD